MEYKASMQAAEPIHYVAWASQPDVQIYCDGAFTTPSLSERPLNKAPIFYTSETPERAYTFARKLVTCEACRERIKREKPL